MKVQKISGWTCAGVFHLRGEGEEKFKERSRLELRRENPGKNRSLLVIMMNPGGSRPADEISYNDQEVPAVPDRTQWSVVQWAEEKAYDKITVINLVDVCEPDSKKLKELDLAKVTSRFTDERKQEFFDLVEAHRGHVLIAWGSQESLRPFARKALAWLHEYAKKFEIHVWGSRRNDRDFFYHPLAWVLGGWRAGVGPIEKI